MKPKKLPDLSLLLELFSYDKDTGVVTRKCSVSQGTKAGDIVGSKSTAGYLKVCIRGKSYPLSRVIYKMMTGQDPKGEIDHINRDRADNRWENLRDVSSQANQLNRNARGYTRIKNGRYRVTLHGKDVGYYNCPTAAKFAFIKARMDYVAGLE